MVRKDYFVIFTPFGFESLWDALSQFNVSASKEKVSRTNPKY